MKHVHIIGKGSQTGIEVKARQWYMFFGLISLNSININDMAGSANNFEITTKGSWLNIFAIGIGCRNIIVRK